MYLSLRVITMRYLTLLPVCDKNVPVTCDAKIKKKTFSIFCAHSCLQQLFFLCLYNLFLFVHGVSWGKHHTNRLSTNRFFISICRAFLFASRETAVTREAGDHFPAASLSRNILCTLSLGHQQFE